MLEFIYYPVSFILWCWHKVFGFIFGDVSAVAWILGIMFLTFTIRGIMFKPFVKQVRSMRKMQDFAPEIKKVQKKYANDKQRQAQEMQKLQREHGVNPLGSCLPMLLQIPVFIGLNWVLRAFAYNPDGGQKTENYFFGQAGVQSYNSSQIFGVNIGDAIHHVAMMGNIGTGGWHWNVAPVAVPLMIAASIATHFTARHSAQRQSATEGNPQAAMMQKLTLWVFPIGLLVFGAFFPIGLLIYFLSNNCWTLMQQRIVYQRIDREEEAKKAEEQEKRSSLGPKPGQKPGQKKAATQDSADGAAKSDSDADGSGDSTSSSGTAKSSSGKPSSSKSTSGKSGAAKGSGSAKAGTSKTGSTKAAGTNKAGAGSSGTAKAGTGKTGTGKAGASKSGTSKSGTGKTNPSKTGSSNGSRTRSSSKSGGSAAGKTGSGSATNKKAGSGQGSASKDSAGKDGASKKTASGNKNQQTNGSRSGGPSKNAGRKRS